MHESNDIIRLARSWDQTWPLKVRKIRLLQTLGLPLDETYIFPRAALEGDASSILGAAESLFLRYKGVLVRTAWTPDLFGAPWFRTSSLDGLREVLSRLVLPTFERSQRESHFTHIILHGDPSDPYEPAERHKWIAGRLLIHPQQESPRARTIEVVHGEFIAKILDTEGFDMTDDRFAGYENDVGQTCWRPFKESSLIGADDISTIVDSFRSLDGKLQQLMQVLAFAARRPIGDLALCVEFGSSRGSDKAFFIYDFDFAFSGGALRGSREDRL